MEKRQTDVIQYIHTKLLTFHYIQADPKPEPILMIGHNLKESTYFERLLGLNFTHDRKWNAYIRVIAEVARRMASSLIWSRKYLNPAVILDK